MIPEILAIANIIYIIYSKYFYKDSHIHELFDQPVNRANTNLIISK